MNARALAMTLLLAGAASGAEVRRFALVVGSNSAQGVGAEDLRYADDDALAMHELLLEAGVDSALLAAPDGDTRRLHPLTAAVGEPTLERLLQVFEAQRQKMQKARERGERVEWIFFFSGHGDVDHGEVFLGLAQGRLTRTALHETLIATAPADHVHVIVDACKSALLVAGKGPGGRRLPFPYAFASSYDEAERVGFLLSASGTRDSHEWERFQSGVFSYEVRSALRGAADTDGDGAISYAELGAFLHTANDAIISPVYRPDFTVVPPGGAAGLHQPLLSWATPATVLADAPVGHLYVERASGERLLDVHASHTFTAPMFLPLERPLYLRTADERSERVLVDEAPVRLSALVAGPTSVATKGSLHLAFQQLFVTPFDAASVERWSSAWKPPDLVTLELSVKPGALPTVRAAAGWGAVATSALGAGLFGLAWQRTSGAADLSQQERVGRNQQIAGFNAGAVVCLVVSAASGVTWLMLREGATAAAPEGL